MEERPGDQASASSEHNDLEETPAVDAQTLARPGGGSTGRRYPIYYPWVEFDLLWWITDENTHTLWLLGKPIVGQHMIEMCFSDDFDDLLGGDWEEQTLNIIRFFDDTTTEYQQEQHQLHTRYRNTIEYLMHQLPSRRGKPGFDAMLHRARWMPSSVIEREQGAQIYTSYHFADGGTVELEWKYKVDAPDAESPNFRATLEPTPEDDPRALLLYLYHSPPIHDENMDAQLIQIVWGLTIMQTVVEGIRDHAGDYHWRPRDVFAHKWATLEKEALAGSLTSQLRPNILTFLRRLKPGARQKTFDMLVRLTYSKQYWYLFDALVALRAPTNEEDLVGEPMSHAEQSILSSIGITPEQAAANLGEAVPVWELTRESIIIKANRLAYWLWGASQPTEGARQADDLRGKSVFEIFSRPGNFRRIRKKESRSFWKAKARTLIRFIRDFPELRSHYQRFLDMILADEYLFAIYQEAEREIDSGKEVLRKDFEYYLVIMPPEAASSTEPLAFRTEVHPIYRDAEIVGYSALYRPRNDRTKSYLMREYELLIERYGRISYVQTLDSIGGEAIIKERHPQHDYIIGPADEVRRNTLHTVVFDTEDEYVRFTDYVYDQFGGAGLELTNVPILTSIRVRSWLLEQTRDQFAMRPVTQEDLARVRQRLRGRTPWDPKNLDDFHVPGVPRRESAE